MVKIAVSQTVNNEKMTQKLEEGLGNFNITLGYEDNLCVKAITEIKQYISKNYLIFLDQQ